MKKIKIIKNRKKRQAAPPDPKKESIIRELAILAESQGYAVKRENLKQGIGWKVMSGSCRFNDDRLIFVDRRLSQSDQISFLFNKCVDLKLTPTPEQVETMSEEARTLFSSVSAV